MKVLLFGRAPRGRAMKPGVARPTPEASSRGWLPHICLGRALPCDQRRPDRGLTGPHDSISLTMRLIQVGAHLGVAEEVREHCRCAIRSEEHTSELQSRQYLVCRLLLE